MNYNTIKIQKGNDCELQFIPKMLNKNIISASELTDITVKMFHKEDGEISLTPVIKEGKVCVTLQDTLSLGKYDVVMHAKWQGNDVEYAEQEMLERVNWSNGIRYENYKRDFVLIGTTNSEMEALRAQLVAAKAAADAAKEAAETEKALYTAKLAALEGIAKEQTLQTLSTNAAKELTLGEVKTLVQACAKESTLSYAAKEATLTTMTATLASLMTYASQIKLVVDNMATKLAGMEVKEDTIGTNTSNTKGKVYELDTKVNGLGTTMETYKSNLDSQLSAIKTVVDEIEGHIHPVTPAE